MSTQVKRLSTRGSLDHLGFGPRWRGPRPETIGLDALPTSLRVRDMTAAEYRACVNHGIAPDYNHLPVARPTCHASWIEGQSDALAGRSPRPPVGVDRHSYFAGFLAAPQHDQWGGA